MAAPVSQVFDVAVSIEAGDWPAEDLLQALAARAVDTAAAHLGLVCDTAPELSFLFTDDAQMRALNRDWRGKDKATNVLSFPAFDIAPGDRVPGMLGDVVLAFETVDREAGLENRTFNDHLTHLMVHGLLHLLGYDHERPGEAEHMEACETAILARLGIADPYAD